MPKVKKVCQSRHIINGIQQYLLNPTGDKDECLFVEFYLFVKIIITINYTLCSRVVG